MNERTARTELQESMKHGEKRLYISNMNPKHHMKVQTKYNFTVGEL